MNDDELRAEVERIRAGVCSLDLAVAIEDLMAERDAAVKRAEEAEAKIHPWYGPCDGLANTLGECSECERMRSTDHDLNKAIAELRENVEWLTSGGLARERDTLRAELLALIEASETYGHQLGCSCYEDDGSGCDCILSVLARARRAIGDGQ